MTTWGPLKGLNRGGPLQPQGISVALPYRHVPSQKCTGFCVTGFRFRSYSKVEREPHAVCCAVSGPKCQRTGGKI